MTKITSENWLETPNNKESFQKVEALFDTVRIKRGSEEPSILPHHIQPLYSIHIHPLVVKNHPFH